MAHKSFRQESRANYGVTASESYQLNNEELQTGALLRIADATELMATNHLKLQSERDMYKRWYDDKVKEVAKLNKQLNAYKGIVKKLKRK